MKQLMSILFFILFTFNLIGQNSIESINSKSFPTNFSKENLEALASFNNKVIAFDGIIDKVEVSRNGTPFYKIKIDDIYHIWTVLMFNNDKSKTDDKVRIVGYLTTVPSEDQMNEIESKYLDGEYMVIAFGIVDFENLIFLFLGGADSQKQEWMDGKIPSSK